MSWPTLSFPEPDPAVRAALLDAIARWQGLSLDAVTHLHERLVAGRGMAQFSHPALGGMGQWLRGSPAMLPLGASSDLRGRVTRALEMLADLPAPFSQVGTKDEAARQLEGLAPARPVGLSPVDSHPCCPHCGGGLLLPGVQAANGRAPPVRAAGRSTGERDGRPSPNDRTCRNASHQG